MRHPPYHLRTNKAVDRLLLVELLRVLEANGGPFSYYSLGGPFLEDLRVMDHTAVTLCRENNIPIIVFDLSHNGNLEGVIAGKSIGTLVGPPA